MTTVTRVYSDLARSLGEEVCLELFEFQKALRKEDIDFLSSPLVPFEKKQDVLNQIGFSKKTLKFLHQISIKKRWPFFRSICEECLKVTKENQNLLEGFVESSQGLSSQEIQKIEESVEKFFKNKKICLQQKLNPHLTGGLRVNVAGFSFNDSILHHFNQFKEQVRSYEIENSS